MRVSVVPLYGWPGHGQVKTTVLDEFPSIIQHQLFADEKDKEMTRLLESTFTFKITFGDGMTADGDCSEFGDMNIGARILYQLQYSMEWGEFRSHPVHHVLPCQVLEKLEQLSGTPLDQMYVILS